MKPERIAGAVQENRLKRECDSDAEAVQRPTMKDRKSVV